MFISRTYSLSHPPSLFGFTVGGGGSFSTLRCKAGGFGKQQGSAKPTMHECISRQKSLEKIDREKTQTWKQRA
jgi:hypothetical protein